MQAAAGSELPLRLARQVLLYPARVCQGVVVGDVYDRVPIAVAEIVVVAARAPPTRIRRRPPPVAGVREVDAPVGLLEDE